MVDHAAFQSNIEGFGNFALKKAFESFEMNLLDYSGTVKNSSSAESDLIRQVTSGCFRLAEYF